MEDSILTSTKKILGVAETYTVFDLDIITHINAAFSILTQLGVGPADGFMIDDKNYFWEDFVVPPVQLGLVKTYILLKVRMGFDPPTTSYLIEATNKQIDEYLWRISTFREWELDPVDPRTVVIVEEEDVII